MGLKGIDRRRCYVRRAGGTKPSQTNVEIEIELVDLPLFEICPASPERRYYVGHYDNRVTGLNHEDDPDHIHHLLAEGGIQSGCRKQPSGSRALECGTGKPVRSVSLVYMD